MWSWRHCRHFSCSIPTPTIRVSSHSPDLSFYFFLYVLTEGVERVTSKGYPWFRLNVFLSPMSVFSFMLYCKVNTLINGTLFKRTLMKNNRFLTVFQTISKMSPGVLKLIGPHLHAPSPLPTLQKTNITFSGQIRHFTKKKEYTHIYTHTYPLLP